MGSALNADDILLIIADGSSGRFALDPIRLMKGAFLAWQQGPDEWDELFDFRPYDYGPFDASVYRARDDLIRAGLLDVTRHGRYDRYSVTPNGAARAQALKRAMPSEIADWLTRIGSYVTSLSFADLLREIYSAFPEFATRSVVGR